MAHVSFPVRWQACRLPKRGHSADEYEDACAANPYVGRFAVADGASESSFAGLWAQLLVNGFTKPVEKPDPDAGWLATLQKEWAKQVGAKPLPWYAEAKRDQGAFATFLGLALKRSSKEGAGLWRAVAVGDSCLFQLRGGRVLGAFPLTKSQEFGNQPALLGSRGDGAGKLQDLQKQGRGDWEPGDRFLLMTDALAQWFLQQSETDRKPAEAIAKLLARPGKESPFEAWVEERRDRDGMRNDDVTLMVIDL